MQNEGREEEMSLLKLVERRCEKVFFSKLFTRDGRIINAIHI